jgi:hypothetical protein
MTTGRITETVAFVWRLSGHAATSLRLETGLLTVDLFPRLSAASMIFV